MEPQEKSETVRSETPTMGFTLTGKSSSASGPGLTQAGILTGLLYYSPEQISTEYHSHAMPGNQSHSFLPILPTLKCSPPLGGVSHTLTGGGG